MSEDRERLIAMCSWWSGWCTDNEETLPDLARLGGFLMDVKHQLATDREPNPLIALLLDESTRMRRAITEVCVSGRVSDDVARLLLDAAEPGGSDGD